MVPGLSNLGLEADAVRFFSQGTLPCLTNEGKIMLEAGDHVAEAPDGNGGIYRALHLSGCVEEMAKRGVKYVHAFAVDNAVCKVADPTWIGYCIEKKADMGCKVCAKAEPGEKVGVLCRKNGKFAVVEYSDIDEGNMNKRCVGVMHEEGVRVLLKQPSPRLPTQHTLAPIALLLQLCVVLTRGWCLSCG